MKDWFKPVNSAIICIYTIFGNFIICDKITKKLKNVAKVKIMLFLHVYIEFICKIRFIIIILIQMLGFVQVTD